MPGEQYRNSSTLPVQGFADGIGNLLNPVLALEQTAKRVPTIGKEVKALFLSLRTEVKAGSVEEARRMMGLAKIQAAFDLERHANVTILTEDERRTIDFINTKHAEYLSELDYPANLKKPDGKTVRQAILERFDALTVAAQDDVNVELLSSPNGAIFKIGEIGENRGIILVPPHIMQLSREVHDARVHLLGVLGENIKQPDGTTKTRQQIIFEKYAQTYRQLINTARADLEAAQKISNRKERNQKVRAAKTHLDSLNPIAEIRTNIKSIKSELRKDAQANRRANRLEAVHSAGGGVANTIGLLAAPFGLANLFGAAVARAGINIDTPPDIHGIDTNNIPATVAIGVGLTATGLGVLEGVTKAATDTVQMVKKGRRSRQINSTLDAELKSTDAAFNAAGITNKV